MSRPKSAATEVVKQVIIPNHFKLPKKPKHPEPSAQEKKPPKNIPFAENRLKGQFCQITEHLFEKAQKAIQEKKL